MKAKDKAKDLVDRFYKELTKGFAENDYAQILANSMWHSEAKQCALICVKNEYHEKRELLFLLKSNGHDIKQYSKWIEKLIQEEKEVKQAIQEL